MIKFDMKVTCEHGSYDLKECTKLPAMSQLKEVQSDLNDIGLGKIKKIEISNIEFDDDGKN